MDKPLHVQVAEALGCVPHYLTVLADFNRPEGWYCACERQCPRQWVPPVGRVAGGPIPRYDTDWSATGPLIEKYNITLLYLVNTTAPAWEAMEDACTGHDGELWNERGIGDLSGPGYTPPEPSAGPTPLIAVCNLILALKTADKLPAHGPVLSDHP